MLLTVYSLYYLQHQHIICIHKIQFDIQADALENLAES